MTVMGTVMALGAHGHMLCSDLMSYHWNRTFRAAEKKAEDVKRNAEREKEIVSEVFGVEDQTHFYIRHLGSMFVTLVKKTLPG